MPPPGYKGKRPSRPKRNRPKRSGPKRGAGGRRANLRRQQKVNKRVAQRRADDNRGIAAARASGKRKKSEPQYLTGRDAAARTASKGTNQSSLQQSVGSLDRRIKTALQKGDTDTVKDLRSRQKKFVKKLGYERAKDAGGVLKTSDGKIMRTSDGSPMLTGPGLDVFQETMDQDFIDPTRLIQNEYPEAYSEMYPIASQLQAGLPGVRLAKEFFDMDEKKIPYNLEDMPGVRYPLDPVAVRTRSNRQSPLDEDPFTISDRQPGLDFEKPTLPGKDEVTDKDRQAAIDRGIDPNFIFSLPDDPETPIVESDLSTGSALQLAEAANTQGTLSDLVEQATNQKNLNVSPNVFALPEQVKENLNQQADVNRKEYEIETYGKEITSDDLKKAGINEAFYNQKFSTPIIQQQLFKSGVIEEKDVQAPIVKDVKAAQSGNLPGQIAAAPLDLLGFLTGANQLDGYSDMTDYVRNEAFAPQQQTKYTGEEWANNIATKNKEALAAIENAQGLDMNQKSSLSDFVNQGGVNLTPTSIAGVQTNDPYNFASEPVVFDEFVQERLNKLR